MSLFLCCLAVSGLEPPSVPLGGQRGAGGTRRSGKVWLRPQAPCPTGAGAAPEPPAVSYPFAHHSALAAGLQGWHPQLLRPSVTAPEASEQRSAPSGSCQLASCFPLPCDGRRSQGLIAQMPDSNEAGVLPVPPETPRASPHPPAVKPKVLPRPPAAAAVGSSFQQSTPGDPPRPCQKRGWGALGRRDRARGAQQGSPAG